MDRANQNGEWKRLVESVAEGRTSFSKLIGSKVIDESEDNLTNVLERVSSKAFLKKLARLGTSSQKNGENSVGTFFWEDKKGIRFTNNVSKLPSKFQEKYQKTSELDASTSITIESSAEIFFWEDKKGTHITDDVSGLPPRYRDRYEKFVKQNNKQKSKAQKAAAKTIPESAKNAVKALKKLEARCQTGISQRDFISLLGDTKFEVNMFVQSSEAKNFDDLKTSIDKTMTHYEAAGLMIKVSPGSGGAIMAQGSISAASEELAKAFQMILK